MSADNFPFVLGKEKEEIKETRKESLLKVKTRLIPGDDTSLMLDFSMRILEDSSDAEEILTRLTQYFRFLTNVNVITPVGKFALTSRVLAGAMLSEWQAIVLDEGGA